MSPDTLRELREQARELSDLPNLKKPTIKILLYTDAPIHVVKESVGRFGLGRMIQQLKAHAPAFADLCIKWEGRYSLDSERADNKINVVLKRELEQTGEPFDEIWVFGVHQINRKSFNLRVRGGTPESELDAAEIDALREWMDGGGGVLITGDHADERPADATPKAPDPRFPDRFRNAQFLGLGRALGRNIPRAGLMRDWEGPPTSREKDSNNTQILTSTDFETSEGSSFFQRDRIPQQLILQTFDELGFPSTNGKPHPLFFYRPGHSIRLFPDHLHEGQVTVSRGRNDDVWPTKPFKPMPQVIAFGTDKRNGKRIKLLAAYDGDGVGVGRIVADSSWHHYFNINLDRFDVPDREDSASDQIGQFYGNLAVWLCPARKRLQMAAVMAKTLALEPYILEDAGASPTASKYSKRLTGMVADRLLSALASPCELHELLSMTVPEAVRPQKSSTTISLEGRGEQSLLPPRDLLLAGIVNWYPPELLKQDDPNLSEAATTQIKTVFARAWEDAFAERDQALVRTAELREKFLTEIKERESILSDQNRSR